MNSVQGIELLAASQIPQGSPTDTLKMLQEKMQEYMASGVRLGWLLNPQDQQVEIYRQEQEKEVRSLPTELSGETVLPGFGLAVDRFPEFS